MPGRLALNAGTLALPAAVLRVVPIVTKVAFARVNGATLIPASSGVLAGSPLTTGAIAEPAETVTVGAFAALVDTGAVTVTTCAFARSVPESTTTPAGADTEGNEITGDVTVRITGALTVGVRLGVAFGLTELLAEGVGVGVSVGVGVDT